MTWTTLQSLVRITRVSLYCGATRIPFTQAMGNSCNTTFVRLADGLEDGAVTIRDRDAMTQERIPLDNVERYLVDRLPGC